VTFNLPALYGCHITSKAPSSAQKGD
jgi:hypothetical protein